MLQVWGYDPSGTSWETNANCIPVIYRKYAEGANTTQVPYAFFISGYFGRYRDQNTDYVNWLDTVNIPDMIKTDIINKKCVVVVDDTSESFSYQEIKNTLTNFAERNQLTSENFIFSTSNINFPDHNLFDTYSDYFTLEYCSHSMIDKDIDFVTEINNTRGNNWEYKFVCLQGEPRIHRIDMYNLLREKFTKQEAIVTLNPGYRIKHDIPFNSEFSPYDKNVNSSTFIWHLINPYHFTKVPVAVVSETFVDSNQFNITEKTFKNLIYPQPFVLWGVPNTIKHLRKLGFDVYDRYVDHSYDSIEDYTERKNAVIDSLEKLLHTTHFPDEQEIVLHNRNIARNLKVSQKFIEYVKTKIKNLS